MSEQFDIDQIIEGVKKGDSDSCFRLVERYRDPLFSWILQRISNPNDAEDILQESFTKCFKRIESYNNNYSFSTWLYTIAKNSALDFLRKGELAVAPYYGEESPVKEGEDLAPSPEDQLIAKQNIEQLVTAIKELSPIYREVSELRFIHDYALEEIAKELNIPLNSVKSRVRRAKIELFKRW